MASKRCLICKNVLSGRSDAKTCSVRCRKRLQLIRVTMRPVSYSRSIAKSANLLLIAVLGSLFISFGTAGNQANAVTSSYLNFQARLLSGSGNIVPDGNYNVEFKIYNASSSSGSSQGSCTGDSNCLWTETRTGGDKVRVVNGYLTVNLGSVTVLPNISWDQQLYLTMNIGGAGSPSWDGEMSPRVTLTSVPYAFQAGSAVQLTKTSGANTGTLSFSSVTTNPAITLPDDSGTVCLQGSVSCGFLSSSTGVSLQGSTPGTPQTGNFNISGVGIAGTALQAPLFDTATATALNIGTNNATSINLNQNVTIASTKTLTVTGGATSLTGTSTGDALTVSNSTSTGNIAVFKDNSTTVLTIADGGAATFKNSANSTSAFQVQNASAASVFNVNTQNSSVSITGLTSCDTVSSNASNELTCNYGGALHISKMRVYGHSYAVGYGSNSGGWAEKTASLLNATVINNGVSGARLGLDSDDTSNLNGGYAHVLQKINRTRSSAPYITNDGVGFFNFGINDIGMAPSTGQLPFKEGIRTVISRDRAAAVKEDSDSSVAYGGSGGSHWSTVNDTTANSGSGYRQTSTNNDTYTISVPSDFPGGTIAVGLIAGTGSSGAVHSFTVDGGSAGSVDTRNIAITSEKVGMVKRFTGLSAGAHTIVGTVSSMSGQTYFDYWQIEASQPPITVIHNVARLASAGYTFYQFLNGGNTVSDTEINTANANIATVVGEFDSNVIVVDTDAQLNADASMFMDTIHPTDVGNSKIASATYSALKGATQTVDQLAYSAGSLNSFIHTSYTDNTSAFQVQNSNNDQVFNIDTSSNPNLITNPSFESHLVNWSVASATLTRDTTQGYSGNSSAKMVTTASNAKLYQTKTLTNSTTYTLSAYILFTSGAFNNFDIGYAYNGSNESTYSCTSLLLSTVNTGWSRVTCTFTPTGITGNPYIFIKSSNSSRTFYVDGVQLEAGASATPYGYGKIQIAGVVTSPTIFKAASMSENSFQIQDSNGLAMFSVSNQSNGVFNGGLVGIGGGGATTGTQLVLDSVNTANLPSATAGGLLYDANRNKFIGAENNTFVDLCTSSGCTSVNAVDEVHTLANTATDANFLVNIASGSTGKFAVQGNGTDVFSVNSSAITVKDNTQIYLDGATQQKSLSATAGFNTLTLQNTTASGVLLLKGDSINFTDVAATNNNFSVSNAGQATFKNRTDSSTAFQIQNSSSGILFNVNTSTTRLSVGTASASALLTVGTNTTSSTGGLSFGNDVFLYRGNTTELRTNAIFRSDSYVTAGYNGSNQAILGWNGTAAAPGIAFGLSPSTVANLYWASADHLQTDDSLLVQPTTNSSDAFQVQNTSNVAIFTVSTSGSTITVAGNTSTFATLVITNSHFRATQTTAPTIGTPTNCGTTPTAAVTSGSTDSAGSFRITAGTGSPTTCDTVITFNKTYGAAPKSIVLTPTTAIASATGALSAQVSATSATTFTIKFAPTNPSASQINSFYYWVVE